MGSEVPHPKSTRAGARGVLRRRIRMDQDAGWDLLSAKTATWDMGLPSFWAEVLPAFPKCPQKAQDMGEMPPHQSDNPKMEPKKIK